MGFILRIIFESFGQAIAQLTGNKLRSFLSLLGITIGIFCIIAVKSSVDSLENDIRNSFKQLGEDVIYVTKQPWMEDPGVNAWKYTRRPDPGFRDFRALDQNLKNGNLASILFFPGLKTVKYDGKTAEDIFLTVGSEHYAEIQGLQFENGRYFTPDEFRSGVDKVVIGAVMAESLFGITDPIGQYIQFSGRKFQVIGIIKRKGKSIINIMDFDEAMLITLNCGRKFLNISDKSPFGSFITVKPGPGITVDELKDDVVQVLRKHRRLKPVEDENFSINELTMLSKVLDQFFAVLNIAGWLIGIFAIFIGMFSVANIMFVSVKERTPIIGIKKALGATQRVILLEFLIESVILCIIGGLLGLVLVFLCMKAITLIIDFDMFLSMSNIILGFVLSASIGVLSGFLPARQAAAMDPVEAMRK